MPLIEKKLDFYGPDVALRNLSYAIAVFGTVASLCFHKASIDIPLGLRRRNKLAVTDLETLRRLTDLRPAHDQDVVCERVGMFRRYLGHFSSCRVVVIKRGCVRFRECCRWRHVHLLGDNHGKNNRRDGSGDRFKAKSVLICAPLIAAAAMFWASSTGSAIGSIDMPLSAIRFALLATGLSYGISQTAVPCEVRRAAGDGDFARAYGRIFTGFCVAGFFGPYVSGILFDAFGTYRVAFQLSGLASLLLCSRDDAQRRSRVLLRKRERWN